MSLTYSGYTVQMTVNPDHPHQQVETSGFSEPSGDYQEDTKNAFRKAMEEFFNSPKFEEMTNGLMDEFSIRVTTLVHTSMPK